VTDWLKRLPGRAVENAVGQGLWVVVIAIAVLLYSLLGSEVNMPAWSFAICLLLLFALGIAVGHAGMKVTDPEYVQFLEWQYRFGTYYAEHLREALETLQRVVTGAIPGVTIEDYITRGILEPARVAWTPPRVDTLGVET
jgi:hypothetical protein